MARLAYIFFALFVAAVAAQIDMDVTGEEEPTTGQPSTTTSAPSTTPAPLPDDPEQGSWNVTDGDRACIMTRMGVRLNFTYETPDNKTLHMTYDIPAAVNATTTTGSSCGSAAKKASDEKLKINWEAFSFEMTFHFDSDKEWYARDVVVTYLFGETYFKGSGVADTNMTSSITNSTSYKTQNGSSFQCVSSSSNNKFSEEAGGPTLSVTTAALRVEAFRDAPADKGFSSPIPCPADTEVSNIVPIAVGAALAGLVVIVLVAYLIGRKKNQRGYESV